MKPSLVALTSLALAALSGCSIPYSDLEEQQFNTCGSDSDCAAGSYCAVVGENSTCVASSVDLDALVFEVRPAAGNGRLSLSSTLIDPGSFSAGDGTQVIHIDLKVPEYVNISPGRVFLPCAGDIPVPARVVLKPVPSLFGLLEGQTYEAASTTDDLGNEAFAVSAPPGVYDIYLEPKPDLAATPDCLSAPPIYLPQQTLSKDTGFSLHAADPLLLTGTLKLSEKEDFTQWYLEVVEPKTGQVISESIQPEQVGIALEVPFQLAFDWTAQKAYTPIVRLRPPAGSAKPFILWSLDAIALQGIDDTGKVPVKLDVSGIATQPRQVGGNVFHDGQPVTATVTLQSTSLSDDELTFFATVAETDSAGHFEALLPPGTYNVIARPHSEDLGQGGSVLGTGAVTWDVAPGKDYFSGSSVMVPSATTLAGTVSAPGGGPAKVEVRLAPSRTGAVTYLGKALSAEIQPRPATTVSEDGAFKVPVDSGKLDLTIVPPGGSGYPWLVRPRLLVPEVTPDAAPAPPVVALGDLTLQNPVVVRGRIVDSAGFPLTGATLRAWIPVGGDLDGKAAPGAVQIGETVADVDGNYFLLLPPSIQ
ncbi:MAG: dickkopf-related protein [Polyangiaceae bacterium]